MLARNALAGSIVLLFSMGVAPVVRAQQQPPPAQKEHPKPRVKKVWTEEDVKDLRKPWDEPAEKKAAPEGPAGKAKGGEKTPSEKSESPAAGQQQEAPWNAPKTVEEAQERIARMREDIQVQVESIRSTREEYFNERDDQTRESLRQTIDGMTKDLEEMEGELKLLEQSLKELQAKAPAPPAPRQP